LFGTYLSKDRQVDKRVLRHPFFVVQQAVNFSNLLWSVKLH
jgi:hypothetical protein